MEIFSSLTWQEVIAQAATFILLVILLRIFLWKPFLQLLDTRRDNISGQIKQTQDALSLAKMLEAEFKEKMASSDIEGRRKIQEAIMESQRMSREIHRKAQEDAFGLVNDAKAQISIEILKAKEELRDDISGLTLDAMAYLVEERLTEEDDRKVVDTFLDKLKNIS